MADVIAGKAKSCETNRNHPFFLYFSHDIHVPQCRIPGLREKAVWGRGDVILQMDWCVGEILDTLERLGLEKQTLIIFSSDNGQ